MNFLSSRATCQTNYSAKLYFRREDNNLSITLPPKQTKVVSNSTLPLQPPSRCDKEYQLTPLISKTIPPNAENAL
jgi:hypothetical protein